jgi:hypothetical protein
VAQQPPAPLVIHPNAVFTSAQLQSALVLKRGTIRREVALGRLRACKRAGRYYFLGVDVLRWLRGGVVRQAPPVQLHGEGADAGPAA